MVRKGVGIILLLVFTVFSISNFASATCSGTMHCGNLDSQSSCSAYPQECNWDTKTEMCRTLGSCSDITDQAYCIATAQIGCSWCTDQAASVCDNGNSYWADSCGNLEGLKAICNPTQICSNGICIARPVEYICSGTINCDNLDIYSCGAYPQECNWESKTGTCRTWVGSCSDITDQTYCTAPIGCSWVAKPAYCYGTMHCGNLQSQYSCEAYPQECNWDTHTAICRTLGGCSDITNQDDCIATAPIGCLWSCASYDSSKCYDGNVWWYDSCDNRQINGLKTTCSSEQTCSDGACVCIPDCSGKECGDDGCGGSCGTCTTFPNSVTVCGANPLASQYIGQCIVQNCTGNYANCDNDLLNPNGCETPLDTNTNCAYCGDACGTGYHCESNVCTPDSPTAYCGNGIIEGTEVCDDGNTANGDGCSSTCTIESGYNCTNANPACCYTITPTTSWKLNGNVFAGGDIAEGDTLTMIINNDLCLGNGTLVNFNIYLLDGTLLTSTPVHGYVNQGTNKISATYTVTQSFLSLIGTTKDVYFKTVNPSITSSVIFLTPIMCDLTSASWGITNITEGVMATLNIAGTNCNGKTISFVVWEYDTWPGTDDPVVTEPDSIIYNSSSNNRGLWVSEWQADNWPETNPPEYYFIASVVGANPAESITSSDPKLPVWQRNFCGNGFVNAGETCVTCIADVPCSSGTHCDAGTQTCAPDCVLNAKSWNVSSALGGQQVRLTATGTNCEGATVSFEVRKYPFLGIGQGDAVAINPNPISAMMTGNSATTTWTAEWPSVNGDTSPQYYFIPTISAFGITDTSKTPLLSVTANLHCGDNIITSPEECDGSALGGATCASVMGTGYTGTLGCSPSCTFVTTNCAAPCTLTSASWGQVSAATGNPVRLNIQGDSNCIGKNISFEVWEKDSGILNPDDPVTTNPNPILYGVPNNYTTWVVEWQDDNELLGSQTNPPEYYFIASVVGANPAESITSSNTNSDDSLLLRPVNVDVLCSGVSSCADYATEADCNADTSLCNVGQGEIPDTITCGGSLNPVTGCYDNTNCGCAWDSGVCKPSWTATSTCGVCGNGFREVGEECDDGNTANGDGCSSTCTFEPYIDHPCPLGLTLCSDGTCSLNCDITDTSVAPCDYNSVCDTGEGCTCSDCNGLQDTCATNLACSVLDTACCISTSDGICEPYCASVDPDCTDGTCGDGVTNFGEECDLGIKNGVTDSGCSASCILQPITNPTDGCPEGTAQCTDGTCSLNCYSTDEGIDNNFSNCTVDDACATGLTCSVDDQACCNDNSDGYCNEYCAFSDPDCASPNADIFSPGTCTYTENGQDTCSDDGMLTRSLAALWTWATGNEISQTDPLGKHAECAPVEDTIVCPASVEVPFFGIYSFVTAIIIIALIYLIYALKKKNKSNRKKKK